MDDARHSFERRVEHLLDALHSAQGPVRLTKQTSNLFRDRRPSQGRRLDVRAFTHVLDIDTEAPSVEVEGMTSYDTLVDAALAQGLMPAVVPQLKSITIGGAAAGVGIEASSFRHGLVHDTLLELEIVTGSGEVVIARPDNEHRELFFGFPNSYGTLGYALRVVARCVPVKPYVALHHHHFDNADACFTALAELAGGDADFLDGVAFGHDEFVLSTGHFVDSAPAPSDYTNEHIYYKSLRRCEHDHLRVADYIWRWDTDWFWCSKNLGAQHPLVRRLLGPSRLNSRFYTRVMRWNSRLGFTRWLDRVRGWHRETVIQDVDIPIARAAEFLHFFEHQIGITPVWLCPILAREPTGHFDLYPVPEGELLVNFGFWDVVRRHAPFATGFHNRQIEEQVHALGGIKSLYSDSYFEEKAFWERYNGDAWKRLKARYDPDGILGSLYDKAVHRY